MRIAFVIASSSLLVALPVPPAAAQTQQQVNQCMNTDASFSADLQIAACTAVIQSGRSGKDFAQAYNNRAIAYRRSGNYDRAIADYNEAIKLEPKNTAAYYNRGIAYQSKGDLDRTISDYNQAVALDPKYTSAYNNLGNAYQAKGDIERAIASYDAA